MFNVCYPPSVDLTEKLLAKKMTDRLLSLPTHTVMAQPVFFHTKSGSDDFRVTICDGPVYLICAHNQPAQIGSSGPTST